MPRAPKRRILKTLDHVIRELECLMETVASLNSKVDTLASDVAAVAVKVAALESAAAPVATQADLDALGEKLDRADAALKAIS